jgi:hypothetical protein
VTLGQGDDFVAAQRALAPEWGFANFREALRSWIATVAIIEVGFVGEWEEYTHELGAREYLEEIRRRAPGEWDERLASKVEPWDERFRAATVKEEKLHPLQLDGEPEPGWWQYRRPRHWRSPASEVSGLL